MLTRLLNWLRSRRQRVEQELVTIEQRRYLSAIFYAHYKLLLPLIRRHARGKFIDLGCGTAPFWSDVVGQVERYHGVDLWPRSDKVTFAGDIQRLEMVPDDCYDSAICIEVLEHLPEPGRAVATIRRILKPGGVVVISVPHLSRLHDLPHDYFRFTEYGLRYLLGQAGMEVISIQPKGGLLTFLAHQLSTVLLAVAWTLPPLKAPLLLLNRWYLVLGAFYADRLLGTAATFPQGYVVVARKPG
ncbi:MAG: methyltransferase domain-containing protein [Caldilineaceae bacterium]|nr:methyltransferase domain-containing protein [Caldilineaceae bacterium]